MASCCPAITPADGAGIICRARIGTTFGTINTSTTHAKNAIISEVEERSVIVETNRPRVTNVEMYTMETPRIEISPSH